MGLTTTSPLDTVTDAACRAGRDYKSGLHLFDDLLPNVFIGKRLTSFGAFLVSWTGANRT